MQDPREQAILHVEKTHQWPVPRFAAFVQAIIGFQKQLSSLTVKKIDTRRIDVLFAGRTFRVRCLPCCVPGVASATTVARLEWAEHPENSAATGTWEFSALDLRSPR